MKAKARAAKIRVMIVDDHPMMRDALRKIISLESDLVVAAEVGSGKAAIDSLRRTKPDVVLMDGSMAGMNGMETTRRLRKLRPDLKIIGLSLYDQTTYRDEMIEGGASGYVLKTGSPSDIINAVRTVARGGTYFDPSIPNRTSPSGRRSKPTEQLSDEEVAVAKLLARGRTRTEIAESLGLSVSQVDVRRAAAMQKLSLCNRAELVRVAIERGWLES